MTDFLDQLEHDLYEAAQRRGGSRSIVRPVNAVATGALIAAFVAMGVWAIDRGAEFERNSDPAVSTADKHTRIKILDDFGGSPFLRELQRLGYRNVVTLSRREEDAFVSSTSTSVYYRPGAEATAAAIARELMLDVRPKPLTPDADKRMFGAVPPRHAADVLVIIGPDDKPMDAAIALSHCRPAGELDAGPLSVCDADSYIGSAVVVKHGERSTMLPLALMPRPNDGRWDRALSFPWAAASPDGDDILVQVRWHCREECSNSHEAYFAAPNETGARSVDLNTRHAWNTTALGWTTDNRAIVLVEDDPACKDGRSSVQLITRYDQRSFVGCTKGSKPPASLPPSIEPRTAREVAKALR